MIFQAISITEIKESLPLLRVKAHAGLAGILLLLESSSLHWPEIKATKWIFLSKLDYNVEINRKGMPAVVDGHILCSKTLLIMECLYNLKFPIQRMSIKMLIVMGAPGKQPKDW